MNVIQEYLLESPEHSASSQAGLLTSGPARKPAPQATHTTTAKTDLTLRSQPLSQHLTVISGGAARAASSLRDHNFRSEHLLRGNKLVVDHALMENYYDRKSAIPAKGPIQLQTHGGEIRWRNVFIREIGSPAP